MEDKHLVDAHWKVMGKVVRDDNSDEYWGAILNAFLEGISDEDFTCERCQSNVNFQWLNLEYDITTFDEIFKRVYLLHGNLQNKTTRVQEGLRLFEEEEGRPFESLSAWERMKEHEYKMYFPRRNR